MQFRRGKDYNARTHTHTHTHTQTHVCVRANLCTGLTRSIRRESERIVDLTMRCVRALPSCSFAITWEKILMECGIECAVLRKEGKNGWAMFSGEFV